jgi:nickel-dependent lactate racemase
VAGHYDQAHRAGAEFLSGLAGVRAAPADIVITTNGGYPLDQNLYQAVKGLTAAEATANPGGIIIMAARCEDGHGGQVFYETFRDEKDPDRLLETFLARPPLETVADQWQSQILARILLKHPVIMVTDPAVRGLAEDMGLGWAPTLDEALAEADRRLGHSRGAVTAVPDGVGVIVRKEAARAPKESR